MLSPIVARKLRSQGRRIVDELRSAEALAKRARAPDLEAELSHLGSLVTSYTSLVDAVVDALAEDEPAPFPDRAPPGSRPQRSPRRDR